MANTISKSDELISALDENTDLKARILRLETENSQLRGIIATALSTLNGGSGKPKPALVASGATAANLVQSGVFKPGAVINVGEQKMFVDADGVLKQIRFFPTMSNFEGQWNARGFLNIGVAAGDCVNIANFIYRVGTDGGLTPI
jgi:hypothetical protein